MLDEVREGLRKPQKTLPSKYFYDERGSRLFEQITKLPEYYPTRTELQIMRQNMPEIIRQVPPNIVLVELGSGSSKKTRLLLDHLTCISAYIPVEISEKFLASVVKELNEEYPDLSVKPVCADYTHGVQIPDIDNSSNHLMFFYPGSTIGNFRPEEARYFLGNLADMMSPGDGMLIGVDLKKDKDTLEDAYNDGKGITAAFNKNILLHINKKLDASFDLDLFRHNAFYNEEKGCIEMHLVSRAVQEVTISGESFQFEDGESIHTENSYKYSLPEFRALVNNWFSVEKVWTDANRYFSVQYLQYKSRG